ncbi:MAG: ROK family protein [Atopobiaceae bacterium]|nr:ROK family protein [Atopobiaceae bacterium]MBR3314802.1 ROK family protein [Atopobiaceae bacterium]
MGTLGKEYREWIATRAIDGATTQVVDGDHISIHADAATAQVSFYCFDDMPEVVELSVVTNESNESRFFLHFELEDLDRAKELFGEMVDTLDIAQGGGTTHVLLCCTVGMTTTMFAAKLNEAAKTLSLDYEFEAKALEDAQREGGHYAAVMLAPQVGFRRNEVAAAFPDAVVTEIPPKVFGAYDAAGALRMLLELLGDESLSTGDRSDLRLMRDIHNDKTIMLVSVVNKPKFSTISFRVYRRWKLIASDVVHKCYMDRRDIADVLATLHVHGVDIKELDAVGIAVPGPVDYGEVGELSRELGGYVIEERNIEQALVRRFGVKVFVDNNANAATVGCYMLNDTYDSVALHTQQVGYLVGGQGTVVNGRLVRGRRGMAGELGAFNKRVMLNGGLHLPEVFDTDDPSPEAHVHSDIPWRADRMLPILATMLLANITVVAPDAIYVAYDLIDDMDALRAELAKTLPEDFIPDLIHITDYHEKIFAGEMALVLQRLTAPLS